ncbi:NUDIX hydrolase [Marinitenerispora sediminis]|uniref:DNA mismatch repair protein MutT n=1 Tax=Marinitenerispora sediminis TaxID=1931232 RepID=A0A368T3Q7_9ACTN|nr:NUDIX domain-containing protein [Marinitenerispora sediminis]RCV54869.1 DNA mismatch repair protein MutT [Marinitenerispora sediminis]RCV57408.1 DNA mismatch repair protein MutT [Marinitenerispora sediminis]RCV60270.1 DNA mismatch repair protein MutT [Marinitenerispora sediminis]
MPAHRSPEPSAPPPAAPGVIDAVAWVHVRDGRLLNVRSAGKDALYLPGGKREPGESDVEALVREVREELSVRLRAETARPFAVVDEDAHGYPAGTRVRLLCYTAEHEGEPVPSREIRELAWVDERDAARCAPAGRRVLEALRERGLLG